MFDKRAYCYCWCLLEWGNWPYDADVENATLFVSLLGAVQMHNLDSATRKSLHLAVNKLGEAFCGLTADSDAAFVKRVASQQTWSRVDRGGEAMWSLRKSLVDYYHAAVANDQPDGSLLDGERISNERIMNVIIL